MREIFLGPICALMMTIGQVCWKIAIMNNNFSISKNLTIKKIFNLLISPYMILGLITYLLATIFYIYLLSKFEFSKIYPILASAYIFALLFAHFIFKENIGWYKISGVLFIIFGIFLISKAV